MQTPRPSDTPQLGYYRSRLVKGGPWVPARIMQTDGLWMVLMGGEPTQAAAAADPWTVRRMEWVAFSPAITEAEYLELLTAYRAATGDHPFADATAPVDWRQGKPIY